MERIKIFMNCRVLALVALLLSGSYFNTDALAQTGSASGYITTSEGKPTANLNIVIQEANISVLTDDNGYFEIRNLEPGIYIIKVFAGEELLQTRTVTITEGEITQADFSIHNFNIQYLSEILIRGTKDAYVTERLANPLRKGDDVFTIHQNIAVINARVIKDIGANTSDDIMRMASGVLPVNNSGQDMSTMIRGTTTNNSILRNGIGIGYFYNMNPDPAMIGHVEFIKGPASFMISNASPGGLVNIITKQPTHQRTLNAEIGYGSWNMMRATLDIGGELKKGGPVTFRLNAGVQNQQRPYRFGYFRKYFVAAAVKYETGKNTDFTLEYNFVRGKSLDDVRTLPSVNGRLFVVPDDMLISDPNASGIASYDHYFKLSAQHRFNRHWSLSAHAGVVWGNWNANGLELDRYNRESIVSNDTIYRYAYKDDYHNKLFNAVAFLQGNYNIGKHLQHQLLGGLDMGSTSVSSDYYQQINGTYNLYYPDPAYYLPEDGLKDFEADYFPYNVGSRYGALYLQDRITIHQKLLLTLAVRYTLSQTRPYGDSIYWQADRKLTPRLGITYLLNRGLSVYAVMDEAYLPQAGKTYSGAQFVPLTGNNREIGLKSYWFEKKLSLNLSLYRTVRNNALMNDPNRPGFQVATGQSVAKGVELDILGQIGKHISLLANYSYTESRVTKSSNSKDIGLHTFNSPLHNIANLFVKYSFPAKVLNGFSLSAGLQYKEKFSSSRTENAFLAGYTLLEAGVGYIYKQWYVNLNVYNLTNEQYVSFGSKYNDTDWVYSPGAPLNFRLGVGFNLK